MAIFIAHPWAMPSDHLGEKQSVWTGQPFYPMSELIRLCVELVKGLYSGKVPVLLCEKVRSDREVT